MKEIANEVRRIEEELAEFRGQGLRMMATSSFQTNSVVLLHLLSTLEPKMPIFFLNTGYHFPETLEFKKRLARDLSLNVIDLRSEVPRSQQRDMGGFLMFVSDPERCCDMNKVWALDTTLLRHDLWVSGVRGGQSSTRAKMGRTQKGRNGILRYHPLLDWTAEMVESYIEQHALPRHPLDGHGYSSVGCRPCTRPDLGHGNGLDDRTGRWAGLKKTECGLHLDGEEQS